MTMQSALYVGSVMHRRFRPRRHDLRHRVFWMLLDLDEIDAIDRALWLFSHRRFNAVSFRDADHGDGGGEPLRVQVERHLAAAGICPDGGAIRLLCMPRILGYGFNPLSIFYCYDRSGDLIALLYEVHNTFHERHTYLIKVDSLPDVRQRCDKCFYVSPFMDMEMTYEFRVAPPADRVNLTIRGLDAEGLLMVASLAGRRMALSDGALLRLSVSHPFLTLKAIGAIHWHALRLWLKGIALRKRPPKPDWPVSIVQVKG